MPKEEPIKMPNEMRQQLILAVRQDQRFRPHALIRLFRPPFDLKIKNNPKPIKHQKTLNFRIPKKIDQV